MPNLFEAFGFIFYFWSNEYSGDKLEPVHVHFISGTPSPHAPKIWINGDGRVSLDEHFTDKVSRRDLKRALKMCSDNHLYIIEKWDLFFGSHTFNEKVFGDNENN